jgi:hypothetical protein
MARTVDTGSTFEQWRQNYNDLATDVGDPTALTTGSKDSLVNAINYIQDQYFFFQDFDFDGSDGASTRTVFSGADNSGNTLQYAAQKVLVYKNGLLLRSGTDYIAINGTSVTLTASAGASDVIRISSYTGSYTATPAGQESLFNWQINGANIYNSNTGSTSGIVFNADKDNVAALVTAPTVANSIQFEGNVYHNGTITVGVDGTGHDVKFFGDTAGSYFLWDQSADALLLTDSTPIKLGDSQDLQIYHDGSDSYIKDAGAGGLKVDTNTFDLRNAAGNETMIATTENGAVNLYYDNNVKLSTVTGGINVTGDTDTDTLTVSGNATIGGTLGVTGVATFSAVPVLPANTIDSAHYVNGSIDTEHYADNSVGASAINVSGNGTNGYALISDGDGSMSWAAFSGSDTTYSQEWVDSSNDVILRLNPSAGGNDDLTMVAGTGITLTPSGDNMTIAATAGTPTVITVADTTDTSSFVSLFESATGDLAPKTDAGLTYNAGTGMLTATGFTGPLTGNVTGNVTGTVATATQNSITTMTGLTSVGTIGTGVWQGTKIASGYIADDAINSQHYANASIDTAHIADSQITQALMAANAIDSDSYVDGSIDLVHLNASMIQLSSESFANNDTSLMTSAAIEDKITGYGYTTETGDITGVTAGTGMSGGGTSGTVTLTNAGVTSIVAGSNVSISGATGAVTVTSTDTNTTYSVGAGGLTQQNFTTTLKNKLDAIEASATADQSNAEIRAAVAAATDSQVFTDADHTKLDGIAASATNTSAPHYTSAIAVGAGGLTQQNFTTTLKNKLDGIAASATNTSAPHYTSAIAVGDGGLTQNNFTTTLKNKLDGIEASATADQTTVSGNAGSATVLATARTIGGVSFNGSAAIVPQTIQVLDESSDTTCFVAYFPDAVGNLLPKTGTNLTFNSSSGLLSTTTITATGDITSNTSSDMALKENIINIPNPLEMISKIGGYMFDWKDHGYTDVHGKGHDTGILAQEIEEILPEIVNTRESGIKAVNYMKLIPLLIESIKELKNEVESLKDSKT